MKNSPTHDDIWLHHMKSTGLIVPRAFTNFRKWSVALGPTEWEDRDVWKELDDHLAKKSVWAQQGYRR
jgi:hypothetical protein